MYLWGLVQVSEDCPCGLNGRELTACLSRLGPLATKDSPVTCMEKGLFYTINPTILGQECVLSSVAIVAHLL